MAKVMTAEIQATQLHQLQNASLEIEPSKPRAFKAFLQRLLPTKHECAYCCEKKRAGSFWDACQASHLAHYGPRNHCRKHLYLRVCKACLGKALTKQLHWRHPLELRCPECSTVWNSAEVSTCLKWSHVRRYEGQVRACYGYTLVEYKPADPESLKTMIQKGTRLCPQCMNPFERTGGCDLMRCLHCKKRFEYQYAMTVKEAQRRYEARAGERVQDSRAQSPPSTQNCVDVLSA